MRSSRRLSGLALLFTLALTAGSLSARAQVCTGNATLYTQEQVDTFPCAEVTGTLRIEQGSITNLDGLTVLTRVGGHLVIWEADGLTSLAGLDSLAGVGGNIEIRYNDALTSLAGLEGIPAIIGYLYITNNAALTSLAGLDGLTTIGDDLIIDENNALTSLAGLERLASIGDDLAISDNPALTSLAGVNRLASVGAAFLVERNNALPSLAGLETLAFVGGFLAVSQNAALSECACGLSGLIGYTTDSGPTFSGVAGFVIFHTNAPGCNEDIEVILSTLLAGAGGTLLDGPGGAPIGTAATVPASGGTVQYTVSITNWAGETNTQLWPALRFPDGTLVAKRTPRNVVLPANDGSGIPLVIGGKIELPASFPAGTYTFFGKGGTFPACGFNLAMFTITKEPAVLRSGDAEELTAAEIAALDLDDYVTFEDEARAVTTAEVPTSTALGSAYPNPFNPSATVPFSLAEAADVTLAVYDVLGREVAVLVDGRVEAGSHSVRFGAGALPSGTYLVRFAAGRHTQTQRLTLVK